MVDFLRFRPVRYHPAGASVGLESPRYLAFLVPAGAADAVQAIDLGPSSDIDPLIATFRELVAGRTRGTQESAWQSEGESLLECGKQLHENLPVYEVFSQTDQIHRTLQLERSLTGLLILFGLIALLLACLGIYGTLAYSVAQRTREIGIRMALGAGRASVIGMVLRESLLPVAIGIALGVLSSLVLTRTLTGFLYGVSPNDPGTIIGAAAILLVAAAAAAITPARHASRLSPTVALRYE